MLGLSYKKGKWTHLIHASLVVLNLRLVFRLLDFENTKFALDDQESPTRKKSAEWIGRIMIILGSVVVNCILELGAYGNYWITKYSVLV